MSTDPLALKWDARDAEGSCASVADALAAIEERIERAHQFDPPLAYILTPVSALRAAWKALDAQEHCG